jgi:diacylglycerol O-acyltransferase
MKPMSLQDSLFMVIEGRQQPMHVAGLHIYTPPAGAGEDHVQQIYQGWRKYVKAEKPFNLRPVLSMGQWGWEEDADFDVDHHLSHLALPRPGRIRELLMLVSRLHGALMDRSRPLWELHLIEGLADGRFALYVKIHHALIDGVTGIRLVASSLSHDPGEIKPPLWAQKHSQAAASRPARSLAATVVDVVQTGRKIIPGLGSGLLDLLRTANPDDALALPFQAPPSLFNVGISGSRRFVAQSYSLPRMREIGTATGATVNDVTLAVCAGALRKYLMARDNLPDKPLIAMVPVSLHGETRKGGNQVAMMLANLATDVADPLDRLQRIVASTAAAKARLSGMVRVEKIAHAAMMLAPMLPDMITGRARKRPAFNLIISNVPGPTGTLYLNGARLDEAYPVSIPADFLALNITVSGYGDSLGFGFTACRRAVPALQRMVDHLDEAFAELESALGATRPRPAPKRRRRPVAASALPEAGTATAIDVGQTPRRRKVRKTPPS